MSPRPTRPRVLLVEDDAVTRAFLLAALQPCGLELHVAATATAAAALGSAHAGGFALALVDLTLPDGEGTALVRALRTTGRIAAAVALTADPARTLDAELHEAGFAALAHKPLSVAAVRALLASHLSIVSQDAKRVGAVEEPAPAAAAWDDEAALATVGGSRDTLAALRQLLRRDLPVQRDLVLRAIDDGDTRAARFQLHRLQAACGFCGAAALGEAVRRLDAALRDGELTACAPAAREAFTTACAAVLED